ncbi:MAG TPA: RtcB family protein [Syntrophomonadaceae bacterium]|nr:RtcB family protein [Syntrophomonadaceae bacterium]
MPVFVWFEKGLHKKPVKIWLEDIDQVEEGCRQQVTNLSNLPFLHGWAALMPDCHAGYGMPIGGVIATEGVIIPNAVGVDIGCGVCFVQTNIPAVLLKTVETGEGKLIRAVINSILRSIPQGFDHHKKRQPCSTLDRASAEFPKEHMVPELKPEIESGYYQVGTLGGGNHFIELQEDEYGMAGIMLHSGSRNFGYKVCRHFNRVARELNARRYPSYPAEYDLAFLPVDSEEGQQYISWMSLALDFAAENRARMMLKVKEILFELVGKHAGFDGSPVGDEVNCHHNYASCENHFGKKVWVHRKGAIRARRGDTGIIPGSMGSYSYIVEGLGNPESFHSCSHGAGRIASRAQAKKSYTVQEVVEDLEQMGVTLGKHKKADIAEECRMVYKDIDFVIRQQLDLIRPVKRLKTIGVVKG